MENTQKKFTIGSVLKESFEIIKAHFWTVIGQFTLIFLCYLILSVGFERVFLLHFIVMMLYAFVVTVFGLSYATKKSFHFDDLLHYLTVKRFCYFVAASIFFGLIVIGGTILLIIPGFIFAIMFGYYKYEILEKDISPLESLKSSRKVTKGYRWKIFGFMLVSAALAILGVLCVFVGILFFLPLVMIADAVLYKKLSALLAPVEPEETVVNEAPSEAVEVEATPV